MGSKYCVVISAIIVSSIISTISFHLTILNRTTLLLENPIPIQQLPTYAIVCGIGESNAVQEMVPLLKSMILLATAPFRVVFITDDTGKEKLVNLTSSHLMDRSTMLQHVDVRFFANGTKEIEEQARQSIQWENIHHSGVWSFIKMLLPWIAPEYDRLAIVDTDLVFVTDPIELWREFDPPYQHQRDWLYSFPTNETLQRGSYNISGIRWSVSICSCIGLLEAAKIRRGTRVFPEAFMAAQRLHIKEKKKAKP